MLCMAITKRKLRPQNNTLEGFPNRKKPDAVNSGLLVTFTSWHRYGPRQCIICQIWLKRSPYIAINTVGLARRTYIEGERDGKHPKPKICEIFRKVVQTQPKILNRYSATALSIGHTQPTAPSLAGALLLETFH